jgi:hypothetical protein
VASKSEVKFQFPARVRSLASASLLSLMPSVDIVDHRLHPLHTGLEVLEGLVDCGGGTLRDETQLAAHGIYLSSQLGDLALLDLQTGEELRSTQLGFLAVFQLGRLLRLHLR